MSFSADLDEQLVELAARNTEMDRLCEGVGRDPASLRRSVNLFDAEARASGGRIRCYDDPGLFERLVTGLAEAGYREIGLYYPADESQLEVFERLATEVIPGLRG